MRRDVKFLISRIVVFISAVVLLSGAVATASSSPAAEASNRPALAVTDPSPVTVRGKNFRARERVTLRATINGRSYVRQIRATAGGAFLARFTAHWDECFPLNLSAAGASGSKATFRKINIPPACGVAPQP